jgi:hypothetical protein
MTASRLKLFLLAVILPLGWHASAAAGASAAGLPIAKAR